MKYIRKATQEDTERIRYIVEECWGIASSDPESQNDINSMVHDFYSQSKLTNEINNNISAFLLAIDGEFVVAFASYKFNSNNVKSSEINALYCLP